MEKEWSQHSPLVVNDSLFCLNPEEISDNVLAQ